MCLTPRAFLRIMVVLVPFLCTSCLSTSLPKGAKVDPGPLNSGSPTRLETKGAIDQGLVDTWEVQYLVDAKGDEEVPAEQKRILIEFTDKGQVIINKLSRDSPEGTKSRTGRYTLEGNQILITDDMGYNSKWTYELVGDRLVLVMPQENKKFHCRRFR